MMINLTIEVEEDLLKMLGKQALEQQLQNCLQKLMVKQAAQEALADIDYFYELTNDPKWQLAREKAWETEKEFWLPSIQEAERKSNSKSKRKKQQ